MREPHRWRRREEAYPGARMYDGVQDLGKHIYFAVAKAARDASMRHSSTLISAGAFIAVHDYQIPLVLLKSFGESIGDGVELDVVFQECF
jgi:hypothetical protein